jgi:dolichol-phosphate mannosyltransferase
MMIWAFLPAFNEEAALEKLLTQLDATLRRHHERYRLVVVDDGSRDATSDILQRLSATMPLDVITHPINRGLGETERDGFEFVAARCAPDDVIVRVEGDATHDPEYIFALIERLNACADVVNTSRFQPGGGQLGVDGYRAFISRCANLFMQRVFPIRNVRDFSCGFRAYRARVVQDAIRIFGDNFIQLRGLGFTSTLEMIVKLNLLGCRFARSRSCCGTTRNAAPARWSAFLTTLSYLLMALLYAGRSAAGSSVRGLSVLYRQKCDMPHRRTVAGTSNVHPAIPFPDLSLPAAASAASSQESVGLCLRRCSPR